MSRISVISISQLKESGVIYIVFQFLVICNDICNVFGEEAAPSRVKRRNCPKPGKKPQKKQNQCKIKFWCEMLIKGKTRAGKVYSHRILVSFKTSLTYNFFCFTSGNCVCCEAAFVGHSSIFYRHCPMLGANIQV